MYFSSVFPSIIFVNKANEAYNKRLVQDFELSAFAQIFKVSADLFN